MSRFTRMLHSRVAVVAIALVMLIASARADTLAGTISVSGSAERRMQPDLAQISIGIESRHLQLETARREAGAKTIAVLRVLDEIGIAKQEIDSSAVLVQPEFAWDAKSGERRLQGYLVIRTIRLRLLEIDKLGAILERSMRAGANQIAPPQFLLREETRIRRELLTEATRDAKQNAIAVADGLGVKLGATRKIETVDTEGPLYGAPMMLRASAAEADRALTEESYKPGEVTLRARVSASFDIAP